MRLFSTQIVALLAMAGQAFAEYDAHADFVQVCNEYGYASESYTVVSEDGYVSQIYRIPGKAGEKAGAQKPAVLMMHGMECDMNFWTPNDPAVGVPPFILADQGYDVWLGNNRGTRYSLNHLTLSTSDPEYWRFSQEELGLKDVPTFIDHILEKTGQDQVTYIGHSEGTTQMFLGASLNPEYFQEKVNLFVALGPVTTLANIKVGSLHKLSKEWREVEYLARKFGAYNLFNASWLEEDAVQLLCNEVPGFCESVLKIVADSDPSVDNLDRLDVLLKDLPSGLGYQNLVYYAQSIQNGEEYLRYNFGHIQNMEVYGTANPPKVPLDQISVPTALFVGTFDNLATVEDNKWLATQLNPDTLVWDQTYPLGHLSFTLAKDMSWFKTDVMALVNQYATNSFASIVDEEPLLFIN